MTLTTTPRGAPGLRGSPPGTSALAIAILAMVVGNVATIVLGPLMSGVVQYPISESMLNQLLGLEVVTLAGAAPWSIWSARLCHRGDPRGPVLAIGPAAYTAYMFAQYVVGPEYDEYSVIALGHVALFSVALGVAVWSFALGFRSCLPPLASAAGRRWALVLAALAGIVAMRYLPAILGSFTQTRIPAEFAASKAFYWSIVLLDLGVVVPATAVGAVAVWRGWAHARVAIAAVLGWFALVPPSVAAMAMVMSVREDPNASTSQTALLVVIAIVAVAGALRGLRRVVRPARQMAPAS